MSRTMLLIIGVIVFVALVSLVLFTKTPNQPTQTTAPSPQPTAVQLAGPTLAERLELAMIRFGNGDEHPLIRQLIADPSLADGDPKEKFQGNPSDAAAIKVWAGWEAHRIAIRAGYVDGKFGGTAWIYMKTPNLVALLLQKGADGKLRVDEYKATAPGKGFGASPTPVHTRTLAPSFSKAVFMGNPDVLQEHPLPSYEFLYMAKE